MSYMSVSELLIKKFQQDTQKQIVKDMEDMVLREFMRVRYKPTSPKPPEPEPIKLPDEFVLHYVMWQDASMKAGWLNRDEILEELTNNALISTETIGYLICETDQFVALAQSVSRKAIDSLMVIPKGMIVEMYKLTNPPEDKKEEQASKPLKAPTSNEIFETAKQIIKDNLASKGELRTHKYVGSDHTPVFIPLTPHQAYLLDLKLYGKETADYNQKQLKRY